MRVANHIKRYRVFYFYAVCMAIFAVLVLIGYTYVRFQDRARKEAAMALSHTIVSDTAYVDLPRITVSLGGEVGSLMCLDLSLEVAKKDLSILQGYEPQITDRLNVFFSRVSPEQLGSPMPRNALRKEILIQINKTHSPVVVQDLFFRQILIR